MLSSRHRRRIGQIVPFGVIWLVFGIVYSVVEKGILADSTTYPLRGNPYDFRTSLVTVGACSLVMGLLMGTLEVYVLGRLFRKRSFLQHLLAKMAIYMGAIILFIGFINVVYYLRHRVGGDAGLDSAKLMSWRDYSFWSIVVYVWAVVTASLLFAEISRHIGHGVLRNFFTGRYHRPKEEERIFMFLDMKASTTIAEQMGHVKYFGLLDRYYADMTEAILDSSGEICQYVGDEIVITWRLRDGVRDNDCLECFFRICDRFTAEAPNYQRAYGRVPGFKAGLHCGRVTTGEIGSVRKDIVFTGDVMNTTARIQSLCNESGVDLLVSETLLKQLHTNGYQVREIGVRALKGKDEAVKLFTVTR
ncbi:MAG TPA: adenylate/guanylate cyclase domain-containing protein [Flavobacteriales bacterium]|jgi:adenylate cyclase|nr:adenylate/guanylate cyclase domain-containing protein [Flavobacteriales bacterium]